MSAAHAPIRLLLLFHSADAAAGIARFLQQNALPILLDVRGFNAKWKPTDYDVVLVEWHLLNDKRHQAVEALQGDSSPPFIAMAETLRERLLDDAFSQRAHAVVSLSDPESLPVMLQDLTRNRPAPQVEPSREIELAEANLRLQNSLRIVARTQDRMRALEQARQRAEFCETIGQHLVSPLQELRGQMAKASPTANPFLTQLDEILESAEELTGSPSCPSAEHPSSMNLQNLLEDVLEQTRAYWDSTSNLARQPIQIELQAQRLPAVLGESDELREAFSHLLLNACDAMPQGGKLRITAQVEGDQVALEFRDTGIGMDEEARRNCVMPFYTTKERLSAGLGLSLVKSIILSTGGQLDIQSYEHHGTSVFVHLPIASPSHFRNEGTPSIPSQRILLVDDDPRIAEILGKYLEDEGNAVDISTNGLDALHRFRRRPYDVVISDRCMLGMNGDELAAAIKGSNPHIPFLLVSGFGQEMEIKGDCPAQIDRILSKPVTRDSLRQAVAETVASLRDVRKAA